MSLSPPVVSCLRKKGLQKWGHGHPRLLPPSYAPEYMTDSLSRVSCPGDASDQFYLHCTFPQISFWIDNQSIPARTALGITTVLAMTTLLFGVQSSLPSVPYIKAVDLFMIVSFANVFAALVEFAVVNYTSMREKESKESKPSKNTKKKYTVVSKSHIYSRKILKLAQYQGCNA